MNVNDIRVTNEEQLNILMHTRKNSFFCGESADMNILCDKGLMEFAGKKPFFHDSYYELTDVGKQWLNILHNHQ